MSATYVKDFKHFRYPLWALRFTKPDTFLAAGVSHATHNRTALASIFPQSVLISTPLFQNAFNSATNGSNMKFRL